MIDIVCGMDGNFMAMDLQVIDIPDLNFANGCFGFTDIVLRCFDVQSHCFL